MRLAVEKRFDGVKLIPRSQRFLQCLHLGPATGISRQLFHWAARMANSSAGCVVVRFVNGVTGPRSLCKTNHPDFRCGSMGNAANLSCKA